MVEKEPETSLEIYDSLPFMRSFPFEEYTISVQEPQEKTSQDLGINPIIIESFTSLEPDKRVNFSYLEGEVTLLISFYLEDLKYIDKNQHKIKKMDSVLLEINEGITSNEPDVKIKAIKKGKAFIKKFEYDILNCPAFREMALDLCEIMEVSLSSSVLLDLQKLSPNGSLKNEEFTRKERQVIAAYLNFQLHYARIILGIVIAAKIF